MDICAFKSFYQKNLPIFKQRLSDLAKNWKDRILLELVFCLCTPQTSPLNADLASQKVVNLLQSKNDLHLKDIVRILENKNHYVRFHITKAKRILKMNENFLTIRDFLLQNNSVNEEREYLRSNVEGFSYKEASHFLRNIGRTGLAIIDRHIINFMADIVPNFPKSLSTRKKYIHAEEIVLSFCHKYNLNIDVFDLAVFMFKTGFFLK